MKYALKANVRLDTKAKSDTLTQVIKDKIASKILWANATNPVVLANRMSEDGKFSVDAVLRFESKADRDEVAAYIRERIERIPALNGEVKCHKCHHDEGANHPPCEPVQEI